VAEKVFHDEAKSAVNGVLPGSVAFKLYDTYGLAIDEQEEMAREFGLSIDRPGFELEMNQQRERARASWKGAEKATIAPAYQQLLENGRTKFIGYDALESQSSRVLGLLIDKVLVDEVAAGADAELVLDVTPFYAESGGQVGDQGELFSGDERVARVLSTFPALPGLTVHRIHAEAPIRTGDVLRGEVAHELREATMRNHTATHLLHAALRTVLGTHVKQAGSVVDPSRLRFDFTHYTAVDRDEIREVERLVNEQILANSGVSTEVMELDKALTTGAMALFGEKYGENVRVVSVPGFSRELCGGTHVKRTGDIGLCKVVYEGSISAGVRRIEAITGENSLDRFQETTDSLQRVASILRTSEPELVEQIERLLQQQKALEKQVDQLKGKLAQSQSGDLESQVREIKGAHVLSVQVDSMDRQQMRALVDSLRNKWKSAVVVLASAEDSNVSIVAAVTKDLTGKVHAGKLAGAIAAAVGGKGGGRPDMAEAGGKDAAALPAALENVYTSVEGML
jgi:alanyl-tRNA synthetase